MWWLVACVVGAGATVERFDLGSGLAAPGAFYHRLGYEGNDPLSSRGLMRWRLGEGTDLFAHGPQRRAYSAVYQAPLSSLGSVRANFGDAQRNLIAARDLGFNSYDLGLKRADLAADLKRGAYGLTASRDRAQNDDGGGAVQRLALGAQAAGFSFKREQVRVDRGLALTGDAEARLLSDDGYGLKSRSGYLGLNALGGLADQRQSYGWQRGGYAVDRSERTLVRDGARLRDTSERLKLGDLSFTHSERALDANFANLREAGYGGWAGLAGRREQRFAGQLDSRLVSVAGNLTRTVNDADHSVSEHSERGLTLRPVEGASVGYKLTDDTSAAGRGQGHALDLAYAAGADHYRLAAGLRGDRGTTGGTLTRDLDAGWKRDKVLDLRVTAHNDETHRQRHALELSTPDGLALRSRYESAPGTTDGYYEGVTVSRKLARRHDVVCGLDYWNHLADDQFSLAERNRVLADGANWAAAYRLGTVLRPGDTELAAEQRSLRWEPRAQAGVTRELTETGVSLAQALPLDLRARGRWTLYETEAGTDRERREAALGYTPGGAKGPLQAEVGWRELRLAQGETRPSLFATARVTPGAGLKLEAELAQRPDTTGTRWTAPDQRSVRLAAGQQLGTDGQAKVEFLRQPTGATTDLTATGNPLTSEMAVDLAIPSLARVLQLSGRYHQRHEPNRTDLGSLLTEHSASLLLKGGDLGELKATYALQDRVSATDRSGSTRLELQYKALLANEASVLLTGYYDDPSGTLPANAATHEQYRVGFHCVVPF